MLDTDTPASITTYKYNSIPIRCHVHSETNQLWLVGADVCRALMITNPSYVSKKFDKSNIKHHILINNQGKQNVTWYSPVVVYKLCLQSKTTKGKEFLAWYNKLQSEYITIPKSFITDLLSVLSKLKSVLTNK